MKAGTLDQPWHPLGTQRVQQERPEVGSVIAYEFAAWRVIEVTDRPERDWTNADRRALTNLKPEYAARKRPYIVTLRPAGLGDDHSSDLYLAAGGARRAEWWQFEDPEHYPVCACCGDVSPCRYVMAARAGVVAMARMERYEVAGVCPACGEPVSSRQASWTWPDNIEVLGGPPVTFHKRAQCRRAATEYERRWVAAAPEQRRTMLSCGGLLTAHNDGTYDCTELAGCPGSDAQHRTRTICREPECHARGKFGCYDLPRNAQRRQ